MKDIWNFIKQKLANSQNAQKGHADKKRNSSSEYKLNDMIWLFTKNIKIERSFRKLDHKWIESYKIKKLSKDACQLNLSSLMKIHDTFHMSLLRSAATDFLTDQIQSSSLPIVVNDEEEYEIDDILNSRYHYEKLQYRVAWIDHVSDRTWYSTENFQNHSKEILNCWYLYDDDTLQVSILYECSLLIEWDTRFWLIASDDLYVESVSHVTHANPIRSDYLSISLSKLIKPFVHTRQPLWKW
jgi:hypothetical protein